MQVALSGLENILRIGKQDAYQMDGVNQFAVMVEEAYGELRFSWCQGFTTLAEFCELSTSLNKQKFGATILML